MRSGQDSKLGWWLAESCARLLEREEREAVEGDLVEAGESGWQALAAVFGLVLRRQASVWKTWRPWLAAFGLALPGSFLLMGISLSVSRAFQHLIGPKIHDATGLTVGPGLWLLLFNAALLGALAWTGGFVLGSVSRRTVWVSGLLSLAPCAFCLERFRVESLSRFCLLLFLPPAIWGVHRGLRIARIKLSSALILAVSLTVLTIPTWGSRGAWLPNWALSWPAWYLVVTSQRPARSLESSGNGN